MYPIRGNGQPSRGASASRNLSSQRAGLAAIQPPIRFGMVPGQVSLLFAGAKRKIMTYNVENFYETPRYRKNPDSIAALGEVIRRENPDVIALQEVGNREVLERFNREQLGGEYPNIVIFPPPNFLVRSAQKVAILSKAPIRVTDSKSHWQEQCATNPTICGKRDFLEATFETDTGFRFTVFNGHFKSMNGGEKETQPVRMQEAASAARIIRRKIQAEPDVPVLVMGDINTKHNSPYGKPVIDTLTMAQDEDRNNLLRETMLKNGQDRPTHSGRPNYGETKLDYIFGSWHLLERIVKSYVVGRFNEAPWRLASDHLPLVTVIEEPDDLPVRKASTPAKEQASPGKPVTFTGRLNRIA